MTPSLPDRVLDSLRFLDATLPTLEDNLGLDEALLVAAEERAAAPVLRVWEWMTPAVVLGASSRLHDDVLVDRCRLDGVLIGRRSSGGGTVLIGRGALNVSVVLPVDAAPELSAVDTAQAFVLERTAAALREEGPDVLVLGSGDLTLGGRKFAGSAQRRLRRTVLVHASLLYGFPLDQVSRYLAQPRRQPTYRAGRNHDDFLTNLPLPRDRIIAAARRAWGPTDRPAEPPADWPADLVEELGRSKFRDPAWVTRL